MKKWFAVLLSVGFFIGCRKENITSVHYWLDNIGSRTDLPFLPDSSANYFSYSFYRATGDKTGLRLKAKFMYARYQSYNVYNLNTRSSISSLADIQLMPDAGNENPFITLSQNSNRNYTVYMLPDIPEAQSYPQQTPVPLIPSRMSTYCCAITWQKRMCMAVFHYLILKRLIWQPVKRSRHLNHFPSLLLILIILWMI
jgi:hypothetical protein